MNFDIDKDFGIFDPILQKRTTIVPEKFKEDLRKYYLPYVEKLVALERPATIGVSAIQGAGKTTQGEILEILLRKMGFSSVSLSIDDHYITHRQLCELREKDPRYIRRGVTHDISLAVSNLSSLKNMSEGESVIVAEYDKGAQKGDGDRFRWINIVPGLTLKGVVREEIMMIDREMQKVQAFYLTAAKYGNTIFDLPENMGSSIPLVEPFMSKTLIEFFESTSPGVVTIFTDDLQMIHFSAPSREILVTKEEDVPKGWRVVDKKPDFIFYDGWMLGARNVTDESVFSSGLPALETAEDQEFAKMINRKLLEYDKLWDMLNFLTVLYVPHYEMALKWREDAEKPLREKGEGMSEEEIKQFVYYFWRSVHPAIQIKNLAYDEKHTNQVAIIGDDHSVVEILSPQETLTKYP